MFQIGVVALRACSNEQVGRWYRYAARPSLARQLEADNRAPARLAALKGALD
jgi:hypothetical protein